MKYLNWFFLMSLMLFAFQNCGSFESSGFAGIYSYSSKPDFFYDVNLVSTETDELGRENYIFDFAVAYAHDPNQSVSYRVSYSTLNIVSVCANKDGTADGETKHFRAECKLPTPDDLYIQLTLVGPQGEQVQEQFRF